MLSTKLLRARSWTISILLGPDSPDEMAFGQLRAPITIVKSDSYAGSSGRISTDPTGERRNRQFRQRFRGLRSCRANPSGESGLGGLSVFFVHLSFLYPDITAITAEAIIFFLAVAALDPAAAP